MPLSGAEVQNHLTAALQNRSTAAQDVVTAAQQWLIR
jgi:hypothetical protein